MNDDQLTELKKYLDARFDKQDTKIEQKLTEQAASLDARFAELAESIDTRFAEQAASLDARFAEQAASIDTRFAEQAASLDGRFAEQAASIERQLRDFKSGEDDKYMKLFHYLREELATVHAEIQAVNRNVDSIRALVDVVAKEHEDEHAERMAMIRQLDRHERWHHLTADKVGLKLDYQDA